MNIRIEKEENEIKTLSPFAFKVINTKGRKTPTDPCVIRTDFERDRDRIIHCKSFRRLKHKTQVFIAPEHDHYRTRLTHTLEVTQISRTISRALKLNEDLTEAIALGHDLGHTPFGHSGEQILNKLCPFEFKHNLQSVRLIEKLEKNGKGLNLTEEVIDGIKCHSFGFEPQTLEGKVVFFADKIAYINHDIDDAIEGGFLKEEDIPSIYKEILGHTKSKRINTMIIDIIKNSINKDTISMSENIYKYTMDLREFLFKNVYHAGSTNTQSYKAKQVVKMLYNHLLENPNYLPTEYYSQYGKEKIERIVCDYIASMTDNYALDKFEEFFMPKAF